MALANSTPDAYNIVVDRNNTGLLTDIAQTKDAADKVSELLQEDVKVSSRTPPCLSRCSDASGSFKVGFYVNANQPNVPT